MAPNVGPSKNKGYTATSQHHPFPHGIVGHWWGPAEDWSCGAATTMDNRLLLATPATSLEQPDTQPCLCQEGQQPKAPCSWRKMGHVKPRHVVGGGPTGGCSRPSSKLHHSLAANPHPAHSDSPATAHTQRHLHQSREPPRPLLTRMEGEGRVWLTTLGKGMDGPWSPLPTKAEAWASGLQDGGGGGLADHVGEGYGRSMVTSANKGRSPGHWSPGWKGRGVGWPHWGGVGLNLVVCGSVCVWWLA